MKLEDKFYLLIVDEIRAQPMLLNELQNIGPTKKAVNIIGKMSRVLGPVGQAEILVHTSSAVPKIVSSLGEQPVGLENELSNWQSSHSDDADNYQSLCRSALVFMLWKNSFKAEEAINLAKFKHDNWAFAHYVYGLLRGLQGDAGKAHFELYLAVHREPYVEARERIERALDVVR